MIYYCLQSEIKFLSYFYTGSKNIFPIEGTFNLTLLRKYTKRISGTGIMSKASHKKKTLFLWYEVCLEIKSRVFI